MRARASVPDSQFASCILHAALVFGGHYFGTENVYPTHLSYLQVMYHPCMIFLFSTQLYWVPQWLVGDEATNEIQLSMGTKKNVNKKSCNDDDGVATEKIVKKNI